MAARRLPVPPFEAREWALLADALESHLAMLDAHDEEWAEDIAATKELLAKVEAKRDRARKSSGGV